MTDVARKLIKTKESVLRFKNGSPKLKDVLRKKCRERLQKNREDFVDKLRNISEDVDVYNTLTNMIKEDLKTIYSSDAAIERKHVPLIPANTTYVEEEMVDEELEWLMSKYDNIFEDDDCLAGMLDDLNEVICPICQKSTLELTLAGVETVVICKCGLLVRTAMDLYQIKENIMSALDEHNDACNFNPQFSVVNEGGENHVYLICYSCSSFHMLL